MKYLVMWEAYSQWKCTTFFDTEKQAEKHAMLLKEKDYNVNICIYPIVFMSNLPVIT